MRLDQALVTRGLARSRTEALELVKAGQVRIDGREVCKASLAVVNNADLSITGEKALYVSRGALKLARAFEAFEIDARGCSALDVGASTGGFTDYLLQQGAKHVTAIDVGHGQMHHTIAENPLVELREGVNARFLKPEDFTHPFDIIVVDISFISLTLILPALVPLVRSEGNMIVLVKPQFEVGREHLGKGGIVRSREQREEAVQKVRDCAKAHGLEIAGEIISPIKGSNGNQEYLLWIKTDR